MPVVALAAFAVAQAVLFQLYLPHRYTYPLVAFFAIVVGVTLRPTWEAVRRRRAAFALLAAPVLVAAVALYAFPLGPLAAPHGTALVAGLPKDAVIAGDPIDLKCLPGTARRAVVISTQLAPSYETAYFLQGRRRMFATLRAYYGGSRAPVADLATRYGATHLYVRREAIAQEERPGGRRWRAAELPYGRFVRTLLAHGEPAVLHLPAT